MIQLKYIIWESLRRLRIEKKYIEWIEELKSNCKCQAGTTAGYSSWFDVKRGLKQESILSSFLLNILWK